MRLSTGASPGSAATTSANDRARHGDDDRVDVGGGVVDGDCLDAAQVDALEVARVASRLGDRLRLLGGVAREHDVVPAVEQHPRERGAPRAGADDEEPHVRRAKSIETGTPSRPKRSRISFSTQ